MGAWAKAGDMWVDLAKVVAVKRYRITHRGSYGQVATEAGAVLILPCRDDNGNDRVTAAGEEAQAVYDVMDALAAGTLAAALDARRESARLARVEDDCEVLPLMPSRDGVGTTQPGSKRG